jgi:two-component system, NtrC family, sensor kinase
MLLRTKMVLILSTVVVIYAGLDHVTQRVLVSPSFRELEREEAGKDLERVVQAIEREARHLEMRCHDWSAWDATYAFLGAPDPSFVESNLEKATELEDPLDLVFLCKSGGEVVWARIPGAAEGDKLRDFPSQSLAASHPLLAENTRPGRDHPEDGRIAGLFMTERGPMLIASRPVLTSRNQGPARGTLILGRLLDDSLRQRLGSQVHVSFDWWPLDSADLPEQERALLDQITSASDPLVRERSDEELSVYGTVPDIQAAPALLIRANVERKITERGGTSIRYALISTLAAGLLLLLVLLRVLQRTVLRPIARLTDHAVLMGRREDPSVKLHLDRDDELGVLSREFDDMIDKLARSRAAVVEAARSAGQSEIATGILHNVGNVLNSVNVSASLVAERVRQSKLVKLQRLAGLAEQHHQDLGAFITADPKGRHFGPYLSELSKLMTVDHEAIAKELAILNAGIEHIRELVQSQQTFTRRAGLAEPTRVDEQVEAALRIAIQAVPHGPSLEVVRDYEELPAIPLDKHRLLEILINVIKNALQSMHRAKVAIPVLRLTLKREAADSLRVEVADNGVGIPEHLLSRIFNNGFTTHAEGHGFGLHGSANTAAELGGALHARSPGVGQGATFILELPCAPPVSR